MKRLISFIQNRRFALSVLCVSLLITGSLFLSSKILMRKDSIIKYGPYYNSETEYDVLFFGTSHVYDGISPIYLYHKYGISSYNMGMNSASVADSYYGLRRLIKEDFDRAFEKVDILVSPTCPNTAFEIGSKISDPLSMYLTDIGTISANLAGIPGMSLPCGFDSDGMPIGLQILAPALKEEKMFNLAYNFEQATDFHKKQPNI